MRTSQRFPARAGRHAGASARHGDRPRLDAGRLGVDAGQSGEAVGFRRRKLHAAAPTWPGYRRRAARSAGEERGRTGPPARNRNDRLRDRRMADRIVINEVGLRDGLQNQPRPVDTAHKLALLDALLAAGIAHVEATSFVSAKAVPQMADAADLMARLPGRERIDYSVLVPNVTGYQRARAAGARSIAVTLSCTETMNRRNINMSLE